MKYAEIIIDISTKALDRVFTYIIPDELESEVSVGSLVTVPFGQGNKSKTGYVIRVKLKPDYDIEKLKNIESVMNDATSYEAQLIKLSYWMKQHTGCNYIEALKTVLPEKKLANEKLESYITINVSETRCRELLHYYEEKRSVAKARVMQEFLIDECIRKSDLLKRAATGVATLKPLIEKKILTESKTRIYRNPEIETESNSGAVMPNNGAESEALDVNESAALTTIQRTTSNRKELNSEQKYCVETFSKSYENGERNTYLLYGVTGSGKTEVYLSMIEKVVSTGRQAIVLIPEIALTAQTVKRFAGRFNGRVTVIHSRLTPGEKYDQFERAKNGEVDVVIGPRSALFAPFKNLGIIVVDEEHENSYKSEKSPRYHARETVIERARLADAAVVLGSATPSVEAYERALIGEYKLLTLKERAVSSAVLPEVSVVDLREEYKAKNFTMFSRELQRELTRCLERKEQAMIFINRRGKAGFVSCIECGLVLKCPHCDVSLKLHGTSRMVCHYCGYEIVKPDVCPDCGSKHIKAFGAGTEMVEEKLKEKYPEARIMRMDADTTKDKDGHKRILDAFARGEADILVGTQMIVKGHDFPNVTLVSALAADLSLFEQDFRSGERTFDLLTQAAGRAGRGEKKGKMIIQTRHPEEFTIQAAAKQDYEAFYNKEISFRKRMKYPPMSHMLAIVMVSKDKELIEEVSVEYAQFLRSFDDKIDDLRVVGPAEAYVYRVNDTYRRVIYVKNESMDSLITLSNTLTKAIQLGKVSGRIGVYYDFDPATLL